MDELPDEAPSGSGFGWKTAAGIGLLGYGVWHGSALVIDHFGEPSCERFASTVEDLVENQHDALVRAMVMEGYSADVVRNLLNIPTSLEAVDPVRTGQDESGKLTCRVTLRMYDATDNKVTEKEISYAVAPRADGGFGYHVRIL